MGIMAGGAGHLAIFSVNAVFVKERKGYFFDVLFCQAVNIQRVLRACKAGVFGNIAPAVTT